MKKTFLFTALATLAVSLLNVAHAQETLTEATVLAVKGSAQVRLSDGTTVPATVGLKLSQGAAITTGKDAQVSIQAHDGIVAVLAGTSQVDIEKLSVSPNGMRNTIMNLRSGNLASSLDPSKKSINNYGVRTAKGVAMAHGTTMTVSVTVSVNGNFYTVSVLAGTVTVNWDGGLSVSIVGNTPADVTSNQGGVISPVSSLATALASGAVPGLTDALTAAAAAVATVATNTGQVTAVIDAIAHAAGTSSNASTLVAGATAAAVGAAVVNSNLVQDTTTTALASTISTAAVTSATDANNPSAAALIVSSAVNAVAKTISGTQENAVAKALVDAANAVTGVTTIQPGQVTGGVHASQNEKGTPITPIDPNLIVNVSPSGG